MGEFGKPNPPAIVEENLTGAIFNYHLMRLRLSEAWIETKYFLYYVQASAVVYQYIRDVNHGATRDGINTEQLSNMPVALPTIEEQREILRKIESYFAIIHSVEDTISKNLDELQVYNQSILAKAFRGELVPQDPNDEPASVLLERIRAEREKLDTNKKAKGKSEKKSRLAKPEAAEPEQLSLPGFE